MKFVKIVENCRKCLNLPKLTKNASICQNRQKSPNLLKIAKFAKKTAEFCKSCQIWLQDYVKICPKVAKFPIFPKRAKFAKIAENCKKCLKLPIIVSYREIIISYWEIIISYRKKIISYEKFAKNYQIRQKLSQNCTKCLIKFAKVIKFAKMAQKWFNLRKSAKKANFAKLPNLLAKSLKMSQISKILKICEKLWNLPE